MLIAFRCYDADNDEQIAQEEVQLVLRNIPMKYERKYGASFPSMNHYHSRAQFSTDKYEDTKQIDQLLDLIFKYHPDGMYFDEFIDLAKEVTSDLFLCIYDCIYSYIPLVQNFLLMRAHYKNYLETSIQLRVEADFEYRAYTYQILMPPVLKKNLDKILDSSDVGTAKSSSKKN